MSELGEKGRRDNTVTRLWLVCYNDSGTGPSSVSVVTLRSPPLVVKGVFVKVLRGPRSVPTSISKWGVVSFTRDAVRVGVPKDSSPVQASGVQWVCLLSGRVGVHSAGLPDPVSGSQVREGAGGVQTEESPP